jgi:integrase
VSLGRVWGLVTFQRLTGYRPGEACRLRAVDIDRTGEIWLYRPQTHTTAHLNRDRVIAIGPRGQDLIREFLVSDVSAYLFSPRRSLEEYHGRLRKNRKTPVQPSQQNRRKRKPKKWPGERVDKLPPCEALRRAQLALYRHPALIGTLAKKRGADFTESDLPAATATPPAAGPTATTSQWAAFVLSGIGQ